MGRRARVTREEVLAAARDAFAERGYEATTLAAIAARVGLSPAALLRHAPGKEALFQAAMADVEAAPGAAPPVAFLATADAAADDPREVLGRLARAVIPFIEAQIAGNIARWMFEKSGERVLRLPFDPSSKASPPQRVFAMLEDYLRRAHRAGRVDVRDPRAAALAFMGTMNAYVFFHRIMKIVDPPLPLDRYLETVLDVWAKGAIRGRAPGRRPPRRQK
jgi:AcrR family transcriptional regulator